MRKWMSSRRTNDVEELADVLEVVYCIAKENGISKERLEEIRKRKAASRGGFKEMIIWER